VHNPKHFIILDHRFLTTSIAPQKTSEIRRTKLRQWPESSPLHILLAVLT